MDRNKSAYKQGQAQEQGRSQERKRQGQNRSEEQLHQGHSGKQMQENRSEEQLQQGHSGKQMQENRSEEQLQQGHSGKLIQENRSEEQLQQNQHRSEKHMWSQGRRSGIIQLIKFNFVGLLNTAVDFVVFTLLVQFIAVIPVLIAQCLAYGAGMLNSFLWNRHWTFSGSTQQKGQGIRFIVVNGITLGLSLLLLYGMISGLGWPAMWSKVLATVITMGLNFIGSKRWVFKQQ